MVVASQINAPSSRKFFVSAIMPLQSFDLRTSLPLFENGFFFLYHFHSKPMGL
jgi:hypothetical protein